MPRTRLPRCTCGRLAHPDARAARMAAARGTRQSDSPNIRCVPYTCPDGHHHTMLWPTSGLVLSCRCGCPALSHLRDADVLLAYLRRKHPEAVNPYVMYRCTTGGVHIARDKAVPADAQKAAA